MAGQRNAEPAEAASGRPAQRRAIRPWRRRLRVALLVAIALLYVASIPWYRTPGTAPILLFGLPDWVAVALGCYAAIAVLNALAWLITEVPERGSDDAGGEADR